jgi:phosphoglycolate phosphatase
MTKRTIIWDFDGTLANSFDFVTSFLAEKAGREMTPGLSQTLSGMSMRGMAKELRIPKRRFLSLFIDGRKAMGEHINEIKPFAGIDKLLQSLHKEGDKNFFALSSNRKKNIRLFLEGNDLDQYFTDMQGDASILGKAHGLRKMLRRNNLKPEDCVYIGDEAGDLKAAHKVGVLAVAVTWGYNSEERLKVQHPVAIAHDPEELLKILRKL